MEGSIFVAPLASIIGLTFTAFFANNVLKEDVGNK